MAPKIVVFALVGFLLPIPRTILFISTNYLELYGVAPTRNAYGISLPQNRHPQRGPLDLPV